MPPFHRFHYSNLGMALLGRSLEKVFCGGCYEQKMKDLILDRLNFSEYAGFNYNQSIIDNQMALGVAYYDDNGDAVAANPHSLAFENPAGGMLASANDMAKFMQFMFRNNMSSSVDDSDKQLLNGT